MSPPKRVKKIAHPPIEDLKPHPLQAAIYGERPEWEIEELAESMDRLAQPTDHAGAGSTSKGAF